MTGMDIPCSDVGDDSDGGELSINTLTGSLGGLALLRNKGDKFKWKIRSYINLNKLKGTSTYITIKVKRTWIVLDHKNL